MRDISSSYMDLLSGVRRIGTRFTFRDERLLFEKFNPQVEFPPPMGDDGLYFDVCSLSKNRGIFRVAVEQDSHYLMYQYIPDPTVLPWPEWNGSAHGVFSDCRPGCVDANGNAQIIALKNYGGEDTFVRMIFDTDTLTLSAPQQLDAIRTDDFTIGGGPGEYSIPEHQGMAIAPVDQDEFFVQFFPYTETRDVNHAVIQYWRIDGSDTYFHEFRGAVYGDMAHAMRFDAVQLGAYNYIFTSDNEFGRPLMFKMQQLWSLGAYQLGDWSDGTHIVPIDVLDDTSFMKLGGAEIINNQIWVTGRLKRGSDIEMEVYMYGDGNFSIGRDMYIGNSDSLQDERSGKLVYSHGYMWYVGWNDYSKAPATNLVGYENFDKLYATKDIINLSIQQRKSSSLGLTAQLASFEDHPAIRKNSRVTVDVGLEDDTGIWEWAQMGVFGVDALSQDFFDVGNSQALVARGNGTKRLAQWTSDAFYDYWSQAKLSANPAVLSEVIRVSGLWSTDEDFDEDALEGSGDPIRLDRLNEQGILYTTAKSSRNGETVGKFWVPENALPPHKMHGRFGVGINYYRESRGQAAERLDKDSDDITDEDFGDNGIFAMIGPEEHNDAEGIGLYTVKDSVWYKIYSEAYSYPKNVWNWLMIRFNEGHITVHVTTTYVAPTYSTEVLWSERFDLRFDSEYSSGLYSEPWFRDQRGRGALAILNMSIYSDTPGFTSTATVIPVEDVSEFPTSETVIVDSEIIDYNGKQSTNVYPGEMNWASGKTHLAATHSNPDWQDVKIHHIDWVPGNAGSIVLANNENYNLLTSQAFLGPYGDERIDRARIVVRREGLPNFPLYALIVNDDFDNGGNFIVGVGRHGAPIVTHCSAPVAGHTVPTSYDWVEFDFSGVPEPLRWLHDAYRRSGKGFFICITTIPFHYVSDTYGYGYTYGTWGHDTSNFYHVKLDDTVSATTGVWLGWGANHKWDNWEWYFSRDTMMPFEIYGVGNTPSEGYEIYIDGHGPNAVPKDYYDGLALVVKQGPGKGNVYQISDYDHIAPDQWVPSRTYLPPDNFADHIDDPNHGDWVDENLSRVFVMTNPYSALGEGTVFEIYPSLTIETRGTQDTTATAHGPGHVSIYSDLSVACQEIRFYSGEVDMRLEDMAKELCAKAGVMEFSAGKSYDGDWVTGTLDPIAEWMSGERRHAIVKFDHPGDTASLSEIGIIVRADVADLATATQYYKLVYRNFASHLGVELQILRPGELSAETVERFPIYYSVPQGTITMSVQEGSFSTWLNGRHLVTFFNDELETGEAMGMYSYNFNGTIPNVDWSELDIRTDNFVLDLGYRGAQLLGGLIGPKQIVYQDTSTGGIYMERTRTSGSAEYELADLTVEAGRSSSDTALVNRVRAEGAEIAEVVDWSSFQEDGNLFFLVNATEANDLWETATEAEYILDDSRASVDVHGFVGAADPRVETNDIIRARTADGFHDLSVDSISYRMTSSLRDAVFDMQIEGRDAS